MNHLFHHVTYQHEHNCYLHWKLRNLNIFLLLMSPIPFLCLTQDSINHDDSDFDDFDFDDFNGYDDYDFDDYDDFNECDETP